MLLTIDIGNSNIKYGVFAGDKLIHSFRVSSNLTRTADEYGAVLSGLLSNANIKSSDITGIILSSVIPSLNYTIFHMCEYFFNLTPMVVSPGVKTGLNIKVENPREVGADRIVNCVSALKKYGAPLIIIDFGTATTFNVVNGKGELIGGVIAPGVKTSLNSLVGATAQLPMIELAVPSSVIAKSTESNMQAGIVFGFAGLVENIVNKIKKELNEADIKVIATGGIGKIIVQELSCIDVYDRVLTLDGLKIIYNLNK